MREKAVPAVMVTILLLSVVAGVAAVGTQPTAPEQSGVASAQSGAWPIAFENSTATNAISISPSEQYAAIGTPDGNVVIYDIPDGTVVETITTSYNGIADVAWRPDGSQLAYSGGNDVVTVSTSDWTQIGSVTYSDSTEQIDYRPDGSQLAAALTNQQAVGVMDVTDTALTTNTTHTAPTSTVRGVAYSPSGDYLAYGSRDHAAVLETGGYTETQLLSDASLEDPYAVAWRSDGAQLAVGSGDPNTIGDTLIYDTTDYSVTQTLPQADYVRPGALTFSPNSERFALGQVGTGTPLDVYDTSDWTVTRTFDSPVSDIDWSTNYVAVAETGFTVYDSEASTTPTPTPTATPAPEKELTIDTRSLFKPNSTHPYSVVLEGTGDVTDNATLTSSNSTVLSVDSTNHTLSSINDSNVSATVTLNASYTAADGTQYTATKEVVVAEATVENLAILPGGTWRSSAVLGDGFFQALLVAMFIGVAMTRFTSAFGGLAGAQMVLTTGWLAGYVPWAMAAVSLFVALFIGLNLAANIDYTVRR